MVQKYGVLSKNKFNPPITRGGNTSFFAKPEENPLTGIVQDQKAAQGEERLARTIEKGIKKGLVQYHYFRWTTLKRGTVGYRELDEFVMTYAGPIAISVKGLDFVHRDAGTKEKDKISEMFILQKLRQLGFNVPEIKSVSAERLSTQEGADKVGRELGIFR